MERSLTAKPLAILARGAIALAVISTCATQSVAADTSPSADLLEQAIAFHDPHGLWPTGLFRLQLEETRPDGPTRKTILVIDNSTGRFEISTQRDGARIEGKLRGDGCELRLNGSSDFRDEEREKYRLTCERLGWLRNYYVYLWGLPMKLLDTGTILDPEVATTNFQGEPVQAVRVTYDAQVGSDIWHFYLHPETHALAGYRFFHDESKGDGEYITLEGLLEAGGLRLPKARAWYTNAEDRYLGTDTLVSIEALPR